MRTRKGAELRLPRPFLLQGVYQSLIHKDVDDLDTLVRRADEDRWLASRFAPPDVRRRLVATYALNHELARVSDVVKTPAAGDIRLAWWRDALAALAVGGNAPAHPVLDALGVSGAAVTPALIDAILGARGLEFEPQPFATAPARDAYIDATAGSVLRLAVTACGADASGDDALIRRAALAWGYTGLLRAEASWVARGWRVLVGEETRAELIERARAAIADVRALPKPQAEIFPALGYVALAPLYLRALERAAPAPALFMRQARLVFAAATGRL